MSSLWTGEYEFIYSRNESDLFFVAVLIYRLEYIEWWRFPDDRELPTMCVCNCTEGARATDQRIRRGNRALFNWITILLITGWVMLVGIAADRAQSFNDREAPGL